MPAQLQLRTDGGVKLLYGSSHIDLGSYLTSSVSIRFTGNYSGDSVSDYVDFSSLSVDTTYQSKPYNRLLVREQFNSSSPFDLMGNVIEFDYDEVNGYSIWSEPLDSIPVPMQYPQSGAETLPAPTDSVPNTPSSSGDY